MRRLAALGITMVLVAGTSTKMVAQDHDHGHQVVTGGGVFPTGWSARPDSGGTAEEIQFRTMGKGYHLTLGTSAIVYRPADRGRGLFHAIATFTQTRESGEHPEGYGLFFGGQALDSVSQRYLYFLVRGDGQYLIKRRQGDDVTEITPWTAHRAIKPVDANGRATNRLAIAVKLRPSRVVFMANDQAVDSMNVSANDLTGIVGIRANHDLDLHIDGFAVHR